MCYFFMHIFIDYNVCNIYASCHEEYFCLSVCRYNEFNKTLLRNSETRDRIVFLYFAILLHFIKEKAKQHSTLNIRLKMLDVQ